MRTSSRIIVTLLTLNLMATVVFGVINAVVGSSAPSPYERPTEQQLPEVISYSVKSKILNDFIDRFNNADFDALYNMFGPIAKTQTSKEIMLDEFKRRGKR